jgi:hypothetical protein
MIPAGRLIMAGLFAGAVPLLGSPFEGLSRIALVLWPWMVILGTPRAAPGPDGAGVLGGSSEARGMAPMAALGWALPPLGLALALDRAAGLSTVAITGLLIPGVLLTILLAGLAAAARHRPRTRHAHGILWTCGVLGLPLLVTAIAWGGGPAGVGRARLEMAASISPLHWLHARTSLASKISIPEGGLPLVRDAPHMGSLALTGPLDAVEILCTGGGMTRLDLDLIVGEHLTRTVPLVPRGVTDPGSGANRPRLVPIPEGGRAAWVGDILPSSYAAQLPASLRARPWPPVGRGAARPRPAALSALGAALLMLFSIRRYPGSVLLLGLVVAGGLARWGVGPSLPGASIEVLEGDLEAGVWTRVLSASGALALGDEPPASLELSPAEAPLELAWTSPAGEAGAEGRSWKGWRAVSTPSARIRARFPSAGLSLDLVTGPTMGLEEVWVRGGDGSWTRHGAWNPGNPLPPPQGAFRGLPEGLPGWLAGALPPGQTVLVARRPSSEPGRRSWVRVSGLSP